MAQICLTKLQMILHRSGMSAKYLAALIGASQFMEARERIKKAKPDREDLLTWQKLQSLLLPVFAGRKAHIYWVKQYSKNVRKTK